MPATRILASTCHGQFSDTWYDTLCGVPTVALFLLLLTVIRSLAGWVAVTQGGRRATRRGTHADMPCGPSPAGSGPLKSTAVVQSRLLCPSRALPPGLSPVRAAGVGEGAARSLVSPPSVGPGASSFLRKQPPSWPLRAVSIIREVAAARDY
ncbi:hypothetical protein PAL_GLEAN10024718 [Pteropus alecto]|uniref:Uncharacterized protein n=1 Tax=Pteropus alecto TaxID=9402 RepID=L5JY76_PTEAL|nr:hypothetical protein PAL_GLEAN10024718 [Pteropus alecto]